MKKSKTDWIGKWYEIAKERGGNDMADMGRVNTRTNQVEWFDFSHAEFDGAGAMASRLRSEGFKIDQLPQIKIKEKPPLKQRWSTLRRGLKAMKCPRPQWKETNEDLKAVAHDLTWVIFSRDQTQKISEYCRDQKISRNAFMLSHLNQALHSGLINDQSSHSQWLFPVNMRGAVNAPLDTSNQSSFIALKAHRSTSKEEFHQQIRSQLQQNIHWATWWIHNIGKVIGIKGMRYLSHRSSQKSHWLGTYSDMGQWPLPGTAPTALDPDQAWVIAPPGSQNHPIGIVSIEWNGRLSLSLKVHPFICSDRQRPTQLLWQAKRNLLNEVEHLLNDRTSSELLCEYEPVLS